MNQCTCKDCRLEKAERAAFELEALKIELRAILDLTPEAVRVQEGGESESLAASLAVTVSKLRRPMRALRILAERFKNMGAEHETEAMASAYFNAATELEVLLDKETLSTDLRVYTIAVTN